MPEVQRQRHAPVVPAVAACVQNHRTPGPADVSGNLRADQRRLLRPHGGQSVREPAAEVESHQKSPSEWRADAALRCCLSMAFNLPDGVLITELEDDLHYISPDDEMWERELEIGDMKLDFEKGDL